ncbi:MAG: phosphotransferase [Desulfobacterales bacterium]|nr:phosphotransferase [Desulfobacterales bacterium]
MKVSAFEKKIVHYLKQMPPRMMGLESLNLIEILDMTPGAYNLNYHVRVNEKKFIFRINIEQQSGLSNQIEVEFMVLKFLESQSIAPKVLHFDDSKKHFDFDILIEEYLEGPHLSLGQDVSEVADLLAKLHSLKPVNLPCVTWKDPLPDTYALVCSDLEKYEAQKTANSETITLTKKILKKAEIEINDRRYLFQADCLNHTDVACDNFIKTAEGLRMIDWEKPRVDDYSYDIGCFLSEGAQLWCTEKILSSADRDRFLQTYAQKSGNDLERLYEKNKIREPLISLHWILWGATKLCDLKDHRTIAQLVAAHEEKKQRYERLSRPKNIQKLLDTNYKE